MQVFMSPELLRPVSETGNQVSAMEADIYAFGLAILQVCEEHYYCLLSIDLRYSGSYRETPVPYSSDTGVGILRHKWVPSRKTSRRFGHRLFGTTVGLDPTLLEPRDALATRSY